MRLLAHTSKDDLQARASSAEVLHCIHRCILPFRHGTAERQNHIAKPLWAFVICTLSHRESPGLLTKSPCPQ